MDQTLRLWDVNAATGFETRSIAAGSPLMDADATLQTGLILTGASDNRVRVFDIRAKGEQAFSILFNFIGYNCCYRR